MARVLADFWSLHLSFFSCRELWDRFFCWYVCLKGSFRRFEWEINGKVYKLPPPPLNCLFWGWFSCYSLMFRLFPQEDQSPFIEHSLFFLVCVFVRNNFKLVLNLLVTPSAYLDDTHFLFDSNVWKTLHLWRWTWCWKVSFPFGFSWVMKKNS